MPRYIPSSITSAFSISGRSTQIRWPVLSRTACSTDQPLSRRNHREANPRHLQRKTTARRSPQRGLARVGNIAARTKIRLFVTDRPLMEIASPVPSSFHLFLRFLLNYQCLYRSFSAVAALLLRSVNCCTFQGIIDNRSQLGFIHFSIYIS